VRLKDARIRLPVVDLPAPDSRRLGPQRAGQVPTPRYAIWEITLACDLKCVHCGSRAGAARPHELTTDECLDVVTQLRELGVGEVTIIGGEAYLRNDFVLIIRAIREAGMRCTMATGGRNLHPARVEAMVAAGINFVSVSIDGLEATHDRLRGVTGSWRSAFDSLARLRDAGVKVGANSQINRATMHELPALMELLAEAGIDGWQLQLTAAFGNAADQPDLLLQPHMLLQVFDTLEVMLARAEEIGVRIWPANNLGYFGPLEAKLRGRQKSGAHYKGCVAGVAQIGLEADGAVKGCPSLGGPENVAGNVREHSLRELWTRAHQLSYIRERTKYDLWGYCGECYYADMCRAGCTATGEPLLGRAGNNPFCHHRAQVMDQAGQRERIEQVAAAPGLPFDHGLYRIVREWKDPVRRAAEGPVAIEGPRSSRIAEPGGPGTQIDTAGARSASVPPR
jgi:radical SAM protein with 4Fe4S-binding SPASM domain